MKQDREMKKSAIKKLGVTRFDASEELKTDKDINLFFKISLEENGIPGFYTSLIETAKALGMREISKRTGLSMKTLYKTLTSLDSPNKRTVNKIINSFS